MDEKERATFTKIIALVLIADGVLGDGERAHLDEVMREIGMDEAEQKSALKGIDLDSAVEPLVESLVGKHREQLVAAVNKAHAICPSSGPSPLVDRILAAAS